MYHERTHGSCSMNVLSHIIRVMPMAANFRSLGGTFGASGMRKLLRIVDQSLEKRKGLILIMTSLSMTHSGWISSIALMM